MGARETEAIDDLCDRLRRVLIELARWNLPHYQLTIETLDMFCEAGEEDAREARGRALRVLDGGRA